MKQKIIILLTIYLLFNSALSAQNIQKMNKSELREHVVILTTQIDFLKNENINLQERVSNLQESISKLSTNSSLLEKKNKTNEAEISRINELILKNKNERKRIISENKIAISKLNEIIITLKDSISSVQSSSNVVSTSTTFNSNDFLNKYYFEQIPLPNNSFTLVLSKLIYGESRITNDRYYNEKNYNNATVETLPEILDVNALTYWGVKPNVMITDGTNFNNYVFSTNSDYFNSKLPKIEVLKNKLFTIKYNDGSEESFLFNVNPSNPEDNNNQRKILQIELANEEVKGDGSNNKAKDIIWRFFAIENECYLALNVNQLNRIKVNLQSVENGIEGVMDTTRIELIKTFRSYRKATTTGKGIYLSRNKDSFMKDGSKYIDQSEIIYLFKLK